MMSATDGPRGGYRLLVGIADGLGTAVPVVRSVTKCLLAAANARSAGEGARYLPLQWLENCTPERVLLGPRRGESVGPTVGGAHEVALVELPAVRLYRFTDAVVTNRASAFVTGGRVVAERPEVRGRRRCDVHAGHLRWHGRHVGLVEVQPPERIPAGVFLAGLGEFNYFHWMIEILPKLGFLNGTDGDLLGDYPLLVGGGVARHPQFVEALECWAPSARVVVLEDDRTYEVADLVHVNAPATLPFNLRAGERGRVSDFLVAPEVVVEWHARTPASAVPTVPAVRVGRRRLFLAREGPRRSYNQEELVDAFAGFGFEPVLLEHLSLREQVALVADAEFIVGPTGAAWTNLVFCAPGTKAVCWMSERSREFAAYSNLAALAGVRMRYVLHPTQARSTSELYSAPFHVDRDEVLAAYHSLAGADAPARGTG